MCECVCSTVVLSVNIVKYMILLSKQYKDKVFRYLKPFSASPKFSESSSFPVFVCEQQVILH